MTNQNPKIDVATERALSVFRMHDKRLPAYKIMQEAIAAALGQESRRETCEVCDHEKLADCISCDLSGEPNPEAFSRNEIVRALIVEARLKEAIFVNPYDGGEFEDGEVPSIDSARAVLERP